MIRLHIVLDNIRSAFNVGSIFRTADATGCAKLYLCGITPYPPNFKLEKTALGAIKSVEWEYFSNTVEALENIQKRKIPIWAVENVGESEHFQQVKYPNPIALILGHEVNGVGQFALDNSERRISIPMGGIKESLNVATAAGIIMFEAIREK